jgi:hypothetical protein
MIFKPLDSLTKRGPVTRQVTNFGVTADAYSWKAYDQNRAMVAHVAPYDLG